MEKYSFENAFYVSLQVLLDPEGIHVTDGRDTKKMVSDMTFVWPIV